MTTQPLTSQTPAQLDEQIYALWVENAQARGPIAYAQARLSETYRRVGYKDDHARVIAAKAAIETAKERCAPAIAAVQAKLDPFNAEYDRRGGWTRYILVPGGHLHHYAGCPSLHPGRTQIVLLCEASGKTDEQVVETYNYTACTKCFPDAPVVPQSTLKPGECEGSRTYRYNRETARLGFYSGNSATCDCCGQRITVTTSNKLRGHKVAS
jgi:hypothetical protein